jgi:uncharacterized pyridoxal phosphate-containing UPF0001 family protein
MIKDTSDRIAQTIKEIKQSLPPDVLLVAAAKTRTPDEVISAIEGGIRIIGYNYIQEAEHMR